MTAVMSFSISCIQGILCLPSIQILSNHKMPLGIQTKINFDLDDVTAFLKNTPFLLLVWCSQKTEILEKAGCTLRIVRS